MLVKSYGFGKMFKFRQSEDLIEEDSIELQILMLLVEKIFPALNTFRISIGLINLICSHKRKSYIKYSKQYLFP